MKKRIIIIFCFVLLVGVCVWRFRPLSFSNITISNEKNLILHSVTHVHITFDDGHHVYLLDKEQINTEITKDILEILDSSSYRQDFRNLCPWGVNRVNNDKNFDGNVVEILVGVAEEEWVNVHFTSSSLVFVGGNKFTGFRIYHPTSDETIYKLAEYIKENGTKQ